MKIIDAHIHLGEWDNPGFFGRSLSLADLIRSYKEWGISGGLVMPTDQANNCETLRQFRDTEIEFKVLPWIKPGDEQVVDFCRENVKEIAGLKFHPSLDKTRITEDSYKMAIEFALDNDLPIAVHCGRWEEIAGSRFPLEIAKRYPKLTVVLSHMGGDTPGLALKTIETVKAERLDNVYLDTAGFREFWVIERGIKEIGAQRFLFASDFPLGHPMGAISTIKHLEIERKEKKMILGENTEKLFHFGDKN